MRAASLPPELEPHADRIDGPDARVLRGGSAIIGPDGEYVAPPVWDREIVLLAELQLRRSREESMTLDVAGHYHRGDVFDFAVRRGNRPAADARAT